MEERTGASTNEWRSRLKLSKLGPTFSPRRKCGARTDGTGVQSVTNQCAAEQGDTLGDDMLGGDNAKRGTGQAINRQDGTAISNAYSQTAWSDSEVRCSTQRARMKVHRKPTSLVD